MSDLGRYRKLYARLWRHPGFVQLTDAERVVAFYLLTGPQTNRLGLYLLSVGTAAEDLGTVPETLKKRLIRVCETFGWLFDSRARVLYLPSWFKWNPPENANVMKGSLKDLNEIPPCGLVDAFTRNIETLPATLHETFIEGLRQRLPQHPRNQEQDLYPNPQPKTDRGAFRTGSEKGNAAETKQPVPDARMLGIARETLQQAPRGCETDYLIDAVLEAWRHRDIEANRQAAISAIAHSQGAA